MAPRVNFLSSGLFRECLYQRDYKCLITVTFDLQRLGKCSCFGNSWHFFNKEKNFPFQMQMNLVKNCSIKNDLIKKCKNLLVIMFDSFSPTLKQLLKLFYKANQD